MKTSLAVLGCVALSAFTAVAQDVPSQEMFVGYQYTRFNSATNVPAFSANGGGGQYAYNFNKWLSAVGDLGFAHNGNIGGFQLDSTTRSFVVGPRVSLRYSRLRPYFQWLFGEANASASTQLDPGYLVATPLITTPLPVPFPGRPITARAVTSQSAFAMAGGGGLDIKINKHMSFRPIGLDWFMTRLTNLRSGEDRDQNNLRYTTGINFTWGAQ